jgi:hypothetical protein
MSCLGYGSWDDWQELTEAWESSPLQAAVPPPEGAL